MPDGSVNSSIYQGTYDYSLDQKGRLANPFRQEDGGIEWLMIVVWPWHEAGTCLRVFPPIQAEKLAKDMDTVPNSDPGKGALKRYINGNSIKVKMDGNGRFTIPAKMSEEADLSGQVVIAGMGDKFEIWNPSRHKRLQMADATLAAATAKQYIEQ